MKNIIFISLFALILIPAFWFVNEGMVEKTYLSGTIVDKDIVTIEVEDIVPEFYMSNDCGSRADEPCQRYDRVYTTVEESHYALFLDYGSGIEYVLVNKEEYDKYQIGQYLEVEKQEKTNIEGFPRLYYKILN